MNAVVIRRLLIAAFLCALGIAGYLWLSEGPERVHRVTVPVHGGYLLAISLIAWAARNSVRARVLSGIVVTIGIGVLGTYLDSRVIYALTPLHPIYFLIGMVALAIEGSLFLLGTWLIDRAFAAWRRPHADEPG